uniref:Peptidase S8 pro-domain domain-containing protein n=1 Tax=Timema genevievae TaxID=629358 RepID=A0A7R9JN91_TIMGE|nr:unnamed protein product [Timema genevievae]
MPIVKMIRSTPVCWNAVSRISDMFSIESVRCVGTSTVFGRNIVREYSAESDRPTAVVRVAPISAERPEDVIGSLSGYYLFEHQRVRKRSVSPSEEHHHNLGQEQHISAAGRRLLTAALTRYSSSRLDCRLWGDRG